MNLLLSLIALVLGPFLYAAGRRFQPMQSSLDGFLFISIAGIVIVHIVPEVFAIAGTNALVFLALGIAFALLIDRQPAMVGKQSYAWVVILGALGLIVHAAMDGIALLPGEHLNHDHDHGLARGLGAGFGGEFGGPAHDHAEHAHSHDEGQATGLQGLLSNHLALGVILHRIPVGMALWWTLRPIFGTGIAVGAIALIMAATTSAYLLGEPIINLMQSGAIACFQAFVAGTLLHVIAFSTARRQNQAGSEEYNVIGERLGALAGLLLIFMVPHVH